MAQHRGLSLRQEGDHKQPDFNTDLSIYPAYAGGVPNASAFQTENMWWDEKIIEATVTRQFVLSHLLPDEQRRLDLPLGFGGGLTDDTYMDWIDQKAKRIFLILVDLGVPDQIFGVIDDSWDDDDLPIPLDQVARLRLTYERDEKFERRFYQRQFAYLLRHMQYGDRIFYDDDEVVPLELVDKRPVVGLAPSNVDKIYLPNEADHILLRRKIPLGLGAGQMPQEEFLSGIEQKRALEHKHLVTIWASYVHKSNGYLLLTPVNDGTLKSFMTITPPSIKIMAKKDRRILFLNWLHCLASALAFLHKQGLAHRKIKPSNVMMDIDNNIFLNDSGLLTHHQATDAKKSFDKESYDYAAPEQWSERPPSSPPPRVVVQPITRHQSRNAPPPGTPRPLSDQSFPNPTSSASAVTAYETESIYTIPFHPSRPDPQKSDIFSLGCVMLDIMTALMKRQSRSFTSHRSSKNKTPGRGGGLPDSSFHKNLEQVESWIGILAKDASKKEDKLFRGVSHILHLVSRMLSLNPRERPDAQVVRERLGDILTRLSGIEDLCCSTRADRVAPVTWSLTSDSQDLEITTIDGKRIDDHRRSDSIGATADRMSLQTVRSGGSIVSKAPTSDSKKTMGPGPGTEKWKPKAKAWQAPVYAGEFSLGSFQSIVILLFNFEKVKYSCSCYKG
jgi:serine/threonine protein kinase